MVDEGLPVAQKMVYVDALWGLHAILRRRRLAGSLSLSSFHATQRLQGGEMLRPIAQKIGTLASLSHCIALSVHRSSALQHPYTKVISQQEWRHFPVQNI